ncbi:MAG: ABC transporter substrate-binding protein [Novosphingobium sp.]|nr:ABC transporter substrate-binding protein [Novosphingobium sp.]
MPVATRSSARFRLNGLRGALLLLLPLLAGACGSRGDAGLSIVAIGDPAAPFATGARLGAIGQTVRQATVEGLVSFDEQGRIISALADRWIVTDDGLSYIFRLRDGTWPDGSAITSQSARASLRQAIDALKGTPLARDLGGIDEIRAMAGRVIEIRLSRPMPHLLQLLAQPELGMPWKGRGAGPMALTRQGYVAVLSPIAPRKRGLADVPHWNDITRDVQLVALPAKQAVERFNKGESDLLIGGRIEHFPLAGGLGISRGTIRIDPVIGLFGLTVSRASGFLATVRNREALAMAIDRDGLIAAFGVSGWTPTTRVVSPAAEGGGGMNGERWAALSLDQRRAQAAARVAQWRGEGNGPPQLRIHLPQGPGGDMLFARLRGDLGRIGVGLSRVTDEGAADLRLFDQVARYPRMEWFMNQLSCVARRGLCSEAADATMREADAAPDNAAREALLGRAETEMTAANVFIPFGQPIRWSLVRGDVTGFSPNRWNVHPLMPMAIRPR